MQQRFEVGKSVVVVVLVLVVIIIIIIGRSYGGWKAQKSAPGSAGSYEHLLRVLLVSKRLRASSCRGDSPVGPTSFYNKQDDFAWG